MLRCCERFEINAAKEISNADKKHETMHVRSIAISRVNRLRIDEN